MVTVLPFAETESSGLPLTWEARRSKVIFADPVATKRASTDPVNTNVFAMEFLVFIGEGW